VPKPHLSELVVVALERQSIDIVKGAVVIDRED